MVNRYTNLVDWLDSLNLTWANRSYGIILGNPENPTLVECIDPIMDLVFGFEGVDSDVTVEIIR